MNENPFAITEEEKAAFAEEFARTPNNVFAAAQRTFGSHKSLVNKCLWAANYLPLDENVLFLLEKAKDVGVNEDLPTVSDAARRAWELSQSADGEIAVKALKLFVEIRQFKEKAEKENEDDEKPAGVMEVPVYGSNEQWENALKEHQANSVTAH